MLGVVAPELGWWFPGSNGPSKGVAASPLGRRIDDLFHMILVITTITFIGTQIADSLVGSYSNASGRVVFKRRQ